MGRDIIVDTKDFPVINIDVMLKPGECPKNLSPDNMGRESCPGDCQNTYLSFMYDAKQERIILEGALVKNGTNLLLDGIAKTGLDHTVAIEMIETKHKDLTYVKEGIEELIIYKGEAIGTKISCGYEVYERIFSTNNEQMDFQAEVRSDPKGFMEKCGIKLLESNDPKDVESLRKLFGL